MTHRVLHLVTSRQRRGAEVFALQLAQNLDASRFQSAFCFVHDAVGDGGLSTEGFHSQVLRNNGSRISPLAVIRGTRELAGLVHDLGADIVVAHGSSTLFYAGLMRRHAGRPKVIYRNIGMASHWASNTAVTFFCRILARRFDAVVTLGHVTKVDFIHQYRLPAERVYVIPNAVDTAPLTSVDMSTSRRATRSKLGLSDDEFVLINVGSLSPEKNQRLLLDLLAHLRQAGVHASLLVAGSGPLKADLEEYARELNIASYVRFLGSRTDVPDLLAASDLMVMPSLTESMPAAVIEAGVAGIPSVAFMIGGLAELIVDRATGILVPPFDREALYAAVTHLVQDADLRADMGTMARRIYMRRFDIKQIAGQYEGLFTTLLARKREWT